MSLQFQFAEAVHESSYARLLPMLSEDPASGAHRLVIAEDRSKIFQTLCDGDVARLVVGLDGDNEVRAACLLVIVPNLSYLGKSWAVVEHVVVDPTLRGQGAGTALIEWAVDQARIANCYKVQLTSGDESAQVGFYRKLGFESDGLVGFKRYL